MVSSNTCTGLIIAVLSQALHRVLTAHTVRCAENRGLETVAVEIKKKEYEEMDGYMIGQMYM